MVMALVAVTASAQIEKGFRMGVQINLGLSDVVHDGCKTAFGYGAGWIAEYNLKPELFLQSGIGLQNIGHKEDGIDGTLRALYAQVPIHVGYRFNLENKPVIFVQGGPTLGIGLAGSKIEYYGGSINYFDSAKRFDLGIGARGGLEFGKYQVSIGANYGVLKVFEGGGHNLTVNLGAAYMF